MTAPSTIAAKVHDYLRIPTAVTIWDTLIDQCYDRLIAELCLETDWLVEKEYIAAVAEQDIYTLSTTRFTRVLAVLHNRLALVRQSARNLDLLSTWTTDDPSSPEWFSLNEIPPGLDGLSSISPEQMVVVPAPSVNGSQESGFVVFRTSTPVSTLPISYLDDLLAFGTTARVCLSESDIRDQPAGAFWQQLYELFRYAIQQHIP